MNRLLVALIVGLLGLSELRLKLSSGSYLGMRPSSSRIQQGLSRQTRVVSTFGCLAVVACRKAFSRTLWIPCGTSILTPALTA